MGDVYVEFFSEEALENVMCLLTYKPERVVYLGHKFTMLTRKINSLKKFAKQVSPDTVLEFIEAPRNDLDACIEALEGVAERYPDAYYELTGGGEMFLIAFGFVSTMKPFKTLRIDPFTSLEVDMDEMGIQTKQKDMACMTVKNNITLHGGTLTNQTGNYSVWRFTDDFMKDIRDIWDIARFLKNKWTRYCATIEDVLKSFPVCEDGYYRLPKSTVGDAVELFNLLNRAGMMKEYKILPKRLEFKFKNDDIRKIVTKTGNILELHVYEVASRKPELFNDEIIGAVIDWNGEKKPEEKEAYAEQYRMYMNATYDTINEIDVILMRGCIPTFISCKSGKASSNSLHELQTVTHRFGGIYAKKALVMAQSCDKSDTGSSFFKQRAKEMDIWVIDNVYNMSDEELLKRLIKIQGND